MSAAGVLKARKDKPMTDLPINHDFVNLPDNWTCGTKKGDEDR